LRNYLKELHDAGLSYNQIAQQTGIERHRVSAIAKGVKTLKSASKEYSTVRNVSRRTAYAKIRESGLSPVEANKYRRIGLSDKTYIHNSARDVAHTKINKQMYQLKMLAEFENLKSHESKIIECFSKAHAKINKKSLINMINNIADYFTEIEETEDGEEYSSETTLINEAVRDGQSKLGGSNWQLKRIIDIETIEYNIG